MLKTQILNRQWIHDVDLPAANQGHHSGRKRNARTNSLVKSLKKLGKNFTYGSSKNKIVFAYPYPEAITRWHIVVHCELDQYTVFLTQYGYGVQINYFRFQSPDMTGRELLRNLADRNILDHTWIPTSIPGRLPYKD